MRRPSELATPPSTSRRDDGDDADDHPADGVGIGEGTVVVGIVAIIAVIASTVGASIVGAAAVIGLASVSRLGPIAAALLASAASAILAATIGRGVLPRGRRGRQDEHQRTGGQGESDQSMAKPRITHGPKLVTYSHERVDGPTAAGRGDAT